MELLGVNAGAVRKARLHGRDYLVAPLSMIVPGVLNGSAGALLYPEEEIARHPEDWNGMPIVVYHPTDAEGNHVSARSPDVLDASQVGVVFGANADGKLAAEGWFDVERTRRVDVRVYEALVAGKPLELSTGLFTRNEPAPAGAAFNGVEYDYVARDYRPDHLAVLPDEVGACGVKDGCGVNVNRTRPGLLARFVAWLTRNAADAELDLTPEKACQILKDGEVMGHPLTEEQRGMFGAKCNQTDNGEPSMNKSQSVAWLVANCDCWKGDQKTLEGFDEEKVKKLVENARLAKLGLVANRIKQNGLKVVKNAEGEEVAGVSIPEVADLFGIVTDPAQDPVGFTKELKAAVEDFLSKLKGDEMPAEEPPPAEEVMAAELNAEQPTAANRRKPAPAPAANRLTAEEQEDLAFARAEKNRQKQALVQRLVGNIADDARRQHRAKALLGKPLAELRDLVELLPPPAEDHQAPAFEPHYFGAAGGPAAGAAGDDSANLLPTFNVDFSEMASPSLRRAKA